MKNPFRSWFKRIPQREFTMTRTIAIVCYDRRDADKVLPCRKPNVLGMNLSGTEWTAIHVTWSGRNDVDGNPLPDFELLGHELWNCPELGNIFHD